VGERLPVLCAPGRACAASDPFTLPRWAACRGSRVPVTNLGRWVPARRCHNPRHRGDGVGGSRRRVLRCWRPRSRRGARPAQVRAGKDPPAGLATRWAQAGMSRTAPLFNQPHVQYPATWPLSASARVSDSIRHGGSAWVVVGPALWPGLRVKRRRPSCRSDAGRAQPITVLLPRAGPVRTRARVRASASRCRPVNAATCPRPASAPLSWARRATSLSRLASLMSAAFDA